MKVILVLLIMLVAVAAFIFCQPGGFLIVNNPEIVLRSRADIKLGDVPNMLVGISVLRQLHLYISYRQERIVVTPASAH